MMYKFLLSIVTSASVVSAQLLKLSYQRNCCRIMTATCSRLGPITGHSEKTNDIIVCGHEEKTDRTVIFFGGDVQTYKENMREYKEWDLENTARNLNKRFPGNRIMVVLPSRMHLRTFSVFENFVASTMFGNPEHEREFGAWRHLQTLFKNADEKLKLSLEKCSVDDGQSLDGHAIILVAFSKGCVVLNQLLYELDDARQDPETQGFVHQVTDMFWLDGGHNGGSNIWITDSDVLRPLTQTRIKVHSHVTPYQMNDPMRKWIKKEQKKFVELLKEMKVSVSSTLHFAEESRSILKHFQVLEAF